MCFDLDSRPPIPVLAGGAYASARLTMTSEDGTRFRAFEARAGDLPSRAAVLILPDVRGLYTFYEELALRFAEAGLDALAIDYFGRTAGTDERPDDFDYRPHVGEVGWAAVRADMLAGARHLEAASAPAEGGRALFAVGFCFGGRLAYLSATLHHPSFAGVIGFYGWPIGGRGDIPAPADVLGGYEGRVLGFFGGADAGIGPEVVASFEAALTGASVDHELITYPGAPHSFFDRKQAEFAAESDDAWSRTLAFIRHGSRT